MATGFGAKVQIHVNSDKSAQDQFTREIQQLAKNSNPEITVKIQKIDCTEAIKQLRKEIEQMLSTISVNSLGVNLSQGGGIVEKKVAKEAISAYAAELKQIESSINTTFKGATSGKNALTNLDELTAVSNKYRETIGLVQQLKLGAVQAGEEQHAVLMKLVSELNELARTSVATEEVQSLALSSTSAKLTSILSLRKQVQQYTITNSKVMGDEVLGGGLRSILSDLASNTHMSTDALDQVRAKFLDIQIQAKASGMTGKSAIESIISAYQKFGGWALVTRSMTKVIQIFKDMVTQVKDIDAAMTQLKIVCNESTAVFNEFALDAGDAAQRIGVSVKDIIASVETFARLGYSLSDSLNLSEFANILANVADMDISDATSGLTSIMKGYGLEAAQAEQISDVLVEVGQKYAVSASELAAALSRGGASLSLAGNTLEQSAALVAAGNAAIQNAETVGNAMKTTGLRLRGATAELEAEGEEVDELCKSTSKLRAEIKKLSGVDIMLDDDNFKSTYDILLEISKVWDQLSDINQAALLEDVAGKRNSSVIASVITNIDDMTGAYESAQDAAGASQKANETYLDSIGGKLSQFDAKYQTFAQDLFSTDLVKGVVDIGSGLIDILDGLTRINALLPITLGLISAISAARTGSKSASVISGILGTFGGADVTEGAYELATALSTLDATQQRLVISGLKLNEESKKRVLQQLQEISTGQLMSEATFQDIVAKSQLSDKNKELLLSTVSFTTAEGRATVLLRENIVETVKSALADSKLSDEQIELFVSSLMARSGTEGLKTSLEGYTTAAIAAELTNPFTWISLAITLISFAIPLIDRFTTTTEEAKEELTNLQGEVDTLTSTVEDLTSTLQDERDALADLEGRWNSGEHHKDLQEEIDLRKSNITQMELELKYQQALLDISNAEAIKKAKSLLESKTEIGAQSRTTSTGDNVYTYLTPSGKLEENIALIQEYTARMQDLNSQYQYGAISVEEYQEAYSIFEKRQSSLVESTSEMSQVIHDAIASISDDNYTSSYKQLLLDAADVVTEYKELNKFVSEFDIQKGRDIVEDGLGRYKKYVEELSDKEVTILFQTEVVGDLSPAELKAAIANLRGKEARKQSFSDDVSNGSLRFLGSNGTDLTHLLENLDPELDKTSGAYKALEVAASDYNIETEEAISLLKELGYLQGRATQQAEDDSFILWDSEQLTDEMDNYSKAFKKIEAANKEWEKEKSLSPDTVVELISALSDAGEEYTDYLDVVNGAVTFNTQAWKTSTSNIDAYSDKLKSRATELAATLQTLTSSSPDYVGKSEDIAAISAELDTVNEQAAILEQLVLADADAADTATDTFYTWVATLKELNENVVTDLQSELSDINTAIKDQEENGSLTADAIVDLCNKYPQLISSLSQTADGYNISNDALVTLRDTTVNEAETAIKAQIMKANGIVDSTSTIISAYSSQLQAINSLATAESAISSIWGSSNVDYKLFDFSGNIPTYNGEAISWMSNKAISNLQDKYNLSVAAKSIGELYEKLDLLGAIDPSKYGVSDKSSSSGSKTEEYTAKIDALYESTQRLVQVQEELAHTQTKLDNLSVGDYLDKTGYGNTNSGIDLTNPLQSIKDEIDLTKQENEILEEQTQLRRDLIKKNIESLQTRGFEIEYDQDINYLEVKNMELLNTLTDKTGDQEATNDLRKDIEDLIETTQEWNDSNIETYDSILDNIYALEEYRSNLTAALDEMTAYYQTSLSTMNSVYDTFNSAAQEFAQNGFISMDTFKTILDYGVEYLGLLTDENGSLDINKERIESIIAARTEQYAVEAALNYVEKIRLALIDDDTVALDKLLDVTELTADATRGLVYAQLATLDLTEEQYNAARDRITALFSLSESAAASIGNVTDSASDNYSTIESALDSVLSYVKELIKYEVQLQADALKDQIDDYREIVDLKKQSLDLTRKEDSYEEDKAELVADIASLQQKIVQLTLDDSRDAQVKRIDLETQLSEKQKSLADLQSDYAYDAQTDSLDKMADAFEESKQAEIDELEATISSEQKLYDLALARIDSGYATLLDEILAYNYEAGSSIDTEICEAWNRAIDAVKEYGSYTSAVTGIQDKQAGIESGSNTKIANTTSNAGGLTMLIDPTASEVSPLVAKMKSNASAWWSTTDSSERQKLQAANESLAKRIEAITNKKVTKSSAGVWYMNGTELFSQYHKGGRVGDKKLSDDEVFALLRTNEAVLTDEQFGTMTNIINVSKKLKEQLNSSLGIGSLSELSGSVKSGLHSMTNNSESLNFNPVFNLQLGVYDDSMSGRAEEFAQQIMDKTISGLKEAFKKKGVSTSKSAWLKG